MPRTLNPRSHQVRRDAFLDVAQRLIQTKGYEAMSVQDVLDALETSRGALYHYFDSKQALLEGVVERFAAGAIAALQPVLSDTALPATRKLERVFAGIAQWKADQRALVLALIEVWLSDANAIVREKLRRLSGKLLTPLLAEVIRQGVREGLFSTTSPEGAALAVVALLQGTQEVIIEQFLGRQAGTVTFDQVKATTAAITEALERVVGVKPGSLRLMDEQTLQFWFG